MDLPVILPTAAPPVTRAAASTGFARFSSRAVTDVGVELGHGFTDLLGALGVSITKLPQARRSPPPPDQQWPGTRRGSTTLQHSLSPQMSHQERHSFLEGSVTDTST